MTAFNPRTAYAGEHAHIAGILDCTLIPRDSEGDPILEPLPGKCVESDINQSPFAASAGSFEPRLRISTYYIWRTSAEHPEPEAGWSMEIEGESWAIQGVVKLPNGPKFECLCSIIGSGASDEL